MKRIIVRHGYEYRLLADEPKLQCILWQISHYFVRGIRWYNLLLHATIIVHSSAINHTRSPAIEYHLTNDIFIAAPTNLIFSQTAEAPVGMDTRQCHCHIPIPFMHCLVRYFAYLVVRLRNMRSGAAFSRFPWTVRNEKMRVA